MCIQTLTNICSRYILEGLAKSKFAQVRLDYTYGIDYTYGQLYVCTVRPKICRTDFLKIKDT